MRALTSWKRPRTECIRRGRRRSFVSAFYHPMQQIKLKGFSSWGGKTHNIVAIQLVLRKCCRTSCKVFFTCFTVPLNLAGMTKRKMNHNEKKWKTLSIVAELSRAKCAGGATWVRKCSNLPIRENLVITWPYTDWPSVRPHHRHANVK